MSRFDLSTALITVSAAVPRVLPHVLKWPPPSLSEVYDVIVALNPVVSHYLLTILAIVIQWILTVLTQSFGWNDRVWALLPPLWGCLYSFHPYLSEDRKTDGKLDLRLSVMTILTLLWGLRLTANTVRRGYYSWGFEDYRYAWIRKHKITNRFVFWIVFLSFVCGQCTILLSLITTPFYFAWIRRGDTPNFNAIDIVATLGVTVGIVMEAIADEQQWRFQLRKQAYLQNKKSEKSDSKKGGVTADEEDGFCQSGLFAWCRHPNYFSEMAIWCFFYLFSVSCSGRWFNWCIIGPVLYIVLFQITTPMAETISSSKYPAYAGYQNRVARLVLMPPSSKQKRSTKQD